MLEQLHFCLSLDQWVIALPVRDAFPCGEQQRVDHRRKCALVRVEITVAGTERQAVFGARHRSLDDLDRETQILDQPLDHGELLEVLDAEHRLVRLHDIEQLADDGGDAGEMARARRTGQDIRHGGHRHRGLLLHAVRVDLEIARTEQGVGCDILELAHVGIECARIQGVVFVLAELQRVDEDAHHHPIATRCGQPDQLQVPLVQVAERRHEHHAFAGAMPI